MNSVHFSGIQLLARKSMILLTNRLGGFTPQVARSQVPPGNAVLEALPPASTRGRASRFALPGRSLVTRRTPSLRGKGWGGVKPHSWLTNSIISGRVVGFFTFYFLLLTSLAGCESVVSAAKDILVTPETPITTAPPKTKNTSKTPDTSRYAALEAEVHAKINQYRQSQNLPPLTLDPRISEQARIHSQAMASGKATFSHDGFEKRVDAIAKTIPYRTAGENLAYNQGYRQPVTQAVEGWLKSPGHYKNIVGDFDLTGVGVVKTAQGRYYFSQIFIRRAKYGFF